jgi:hypothetical protein
MAPRITLTSGAALRPGTPVAGVIRWDLPAPPSSAELRLVWFTVGEGTPEHTVVRLEPVASLPALPAEGGPYREAPAIAGADLALRCQEDRRFSFLAPEGPHSFDGALFSLGWALELAVEPDTLSDRVDLCLSPTGEPIQIAPTRRSTDPPPPETPPLAEAPPPRPAPR